MKKKLFCWCDFLVATGFGQVASNLLDTMHLEYDVQVLGINYHGDKRYDSSKYFVYPISKDDMLGFKRLIPLLKREQPDIVFLFQDIFHISDIIDKVRAVLPPTSKIVIYFPVDGQPFSQAWENVFKIADSVITYSDWAIKVVQDRFPNIKNMHKLYHGVDTKVYRPLKYKEILEKKENFGWKRKFVVTNLNRFQPRKAIPLSVRAFSMFAKGYKECKCGNRMPLDRTSCDLNPCPKEHIVNVVIHDKKDVFLYLHMMANEPCMGPGRSNLLQNHLLNAGFQDNDVNTIIGVNASNIYGGAVSNEVVNDIYNVSNINISSTLGEGKLLEGTLILTKQGYKYIEEISEEDEVINDKGYFTKVNKTQATKFTEDMYSIKLWKFAEPIICSHDHPFLTQSGEYKRADKLSLNDVLSLKIPRYSEYNVGNTDKIDLKLYANPKYYTITDTYVESKQSKAKCKLPRYLNIDKDLCRLFGLYIAEGSKNSSGISFSFHNKEIDLHKFVIDCYSNKINIHNSYKCPKFVKSKKDASGAIQLNGAPLSKLFEDLFGNNAHNKKFPLWFLYLEKDCRESLLQGLIEGDGDVSKKNTFTRYKTVSKKLAYLVRDLGLTLNKVFSIRLEDNSRGYSSGNIYTVTYYEDNEADIKKGQITRKYDINDGCVNIQIRAIENVKPYGIGYDLEVPDGESYNIGQVTSHNCGLSLIEAAAAGTPSIAPANSAVPEMLRDTGHLIANSAVMNQAMDNGHLRPVVDVWKMTEALEIEYKKWKESPNEKIIDQSCILNVKANFLWKDKVEMLSKIFREVLK